MSRMFIAFATAAAVMTFAAGAQAQTSDAPQDQARVPMQRTVHANVDFNDAKQTQAFYVKLQVAAHSVCHSEISNLEIERADRACERQALSDAVKQVNVAQLTQLYARLDGHDDAHAPMLAAAGQ